MDPRHWWQDKEDRWEAIGWHGFHLRRSMEVGLYRGFHIEDESGARLSAMLALIPVLHKATNLFGADDWEARMKAMKDSTDDAKHGAVESTSRMPRADCVRHISSCFVLRAIPRYMCYLASCLPADGRSWMKHELSKTDGNYELPGFTSFDRGSS